MVCCSSSCCYFSCCCTYQSVKVRIPWYHVVQPRLTHSLSWTIHFKTNNTEIMLPQLHCHFFSSIKGCVVQIKIGLLVILTLCPTTCSSTYLVCLCLPFPALFALVFSIPPLLPQKILDDEAAICEQCWTLTVLRSSQLQGWHPVWT